jgi:hypothetical protein
MGKKATKSPKSKKATEKPVKLNISFEDALRLAAKTKITKKGK